MSSQVASLTSFLKKSMKQKEALTYQQKKFNKSSSNRNSLSNYSIYSHVYMVSIP